jgi:hypothetical protein
MKVADVFPSNYIKADDLQGREVPVVIADAKIEKLGNDQKLILYFQHKDKGMVCNKTNANRIAYLYGEDTDGWLGRPIILCSEFVEFQGRTVKGLRIKPPANGAASPAAPASPPRPAPISNRAHTEIDPPPVDDIPF